MSSKALPDVDWSNSFWGCCSPMGTCMCVVCPPVIVPADGFRCIWLLLPMRLIWEGSISA